MTNARVKKVLGLALEIAVTAGALTFVLHDPGKRAQMAAALRAADWRWLAIGLAIYGGVEVLALVRWKLLLHIQKFDISWSRAAGILFIGEFFLTVTPGLVGGDVMRIFYLVRDRPDKKVDALTVVLMDRVMGMLSLIILAAITLSARYPWLSQAPFAAGLVQAVSLILSFGAAALAAAFLIARAGVLDRPTLPRFLRDLGTAFGQFSQDWPRTVQAFITTLFSHLCYYTSFCCAARALEGVASPSADFLDVFSIMPIENTLTALPISFAGIGLRESLFQGLLHDLAGVNSAVGALIGSLGFSMKVLWSLPGAVVFIAYGLAGRRRRAIEPRLDVAAPQVSAPPAA